jgi:hypothetical protein
VSEPKQPREAWAEVGRQFEELGKALGEHFSRPDAASWQASRASEPGSGRDERRAVLDALRRVGDAAQQLGDQAGEAVRDQQLRETARSATRVLADALETTFGQLAEQLRRTGGAAGGGGDRPEPDAWSRASDPDAPQAIVDPVPAADPASPSAGGAGPDGAGTSGAMEDPEATPGPDPDPAPGDSPDPDQVPTRPPSDS